MSRHQTPTVLPSLTSLRILAAMAVVIHHSRHSWSHINVVNWIISIAGLGMPFFFALSGFVLMWVFEPISLRDFLVKRLARIYPLHITTLIFSLVAYAVLKFPVGGEVGNFWGTIADMFLVHAWIPGYFNVRQGWNGVTWSLSCEFLYYLMVPWLFPKLLRSDPFKRLAWLAFAWVILIVLSIISCMKLSKAGGDFFLMHPIPHFVEFLVGATVAQMLKSGVSLKSHWPGIIGIFIPSVCCIYGERFYPILSLLSIPGSVLLICSCATFDLEERRNWLQNPSLILLGEASFSLYMTHEMYRALLAHALPYEFSDLMRTPIAEVFTIFYLASSLWMSILIYQKFEIPAQRWFLKKFGRTKKEPDLLSHRQSA